MTDDLVKRLREDQPVTQDMESTIQCALQDEAADRIEALKAEQCVEVKPRLWEVDHPYYMNEGNFFEAGNFSEYECLDDFLAAWADADLDMNRVHRWDWREGEDWGVDGDDADDVLGRLDLFYVMQRKAYTYSCSVKVRRSDEPRVIEFLKPHFDREVSIWRPFTTRPASEVRAEAHAAAVEAAAGEFDGWNGVPVQMTYDEAREALRALHTDASLAAIERIKREARNEVLNGVAKALSHAGNEDAASIVTALIEKEGV